MTARHRQYRATYAGACRGAYRRIVERCEGRRLADAHLYSGLPYCTWSQFWDWANWPLMLQDWVELRAAYVTSGRPADRPAINRLCMRLGWGFVPGNLRWCRLGDAAGKANIQRAYGERACRSDYTKAAALEATRAGRVEFC